jgi:uncharacterized protein (DUF433 family)
MMTATGAYTADRAAALSGVPKSTLYSWARSDILVPSVSPTKVRLWSHSDLLALRVIYWLRQKKTAETGVEIPSSSLPAVRRALRELGHLAIPLLRDDRPSVLVDTKGQIHIDATAHVTTVGGQLVAPDTLDLIAPFTTLEGGTGPDLLRPRPQLRIVPGKLGGSPHVEHTRLETLALASLSADGLTTEQIRDLYPYVENAQILEALDLEAQLARNLTLVAAA